MPKTTYQLHSMHGPTVFEYPSLSRALEVLFTGRLKNSNGGTYRVLNSLTGKEYARMNTYATYDVLNYEANAARRGK